MATDYKWKMLFSGSTVSNNMSWQINGRLEMDLMYNDYVANGDVQANDLVTGTADTRITALAAEFRDISGGTDYASITVVSAREMHLIIAESNVASGGAIAELNKIRALDELAPYTTEDAGAALQAERRANLFVQGRRLSDMYRFGVSSLVWDNVEKSPAGTFFPITIREIRANPNLSQ
jgi:hypothetical protein